jgi:glycosyltransferase involved in cell wall biosynthesis
MLIQIKQSDLTSSSDEKNVVKSQRVEQVRVAIVHYWLLNMRGGERVLEELLKCFPGADIFTHVYAPEKVSDLIRSHKVTETFIGHLPWARIHYQKYLALMPLALEELDLRGYDLVISSESGPAKGVITHPKTTHICYCHSPMRYLYDQYREYSDGLSYPARIIFRHLAHRLRQWDFASAARVDHFVANSSFVSQRIRHAYGRDSTVIMPPVDTEKYYIDEYQEKKYHNKEDYYLVVSEFVPYKRIDLAIETINTSSRRLIIVGGGKMDREYKRIASKNVEFVGRVSNERLRELYQRARALIFPGEEDFGIVPLEAMACGCPVIAYGSGGIRDTVIDGVTGIFFDRQTPTDLQAALTRFEQTAFNSASVAGHARDHSASVFREQILQLVNDVFVSRDRSGQRAFARNEAARAA